MTAHKPKVYCARCRETFKIQEPPPHAKRGFCGEDGCHRPMWDRGAGKGKVAEVGVEPKHADWKPYYRLRGTLHPRYGS